MMTHTVDQGISYTELHIFITWRKRRGFCTAVSVRYGVILLHFAGANAIHPKRRTSWQRADFLACRKWLGDATEQTKTNPSGWFEVARHLATCQQCLHLGRQPQCPSIISIIEWFDAIGITCQ